jgi:hypothetical protein
VKLWGVSMVRNEEDILEAFVRHNLTAVDGLIIVDHGSADATPGILKALCAERLPIVALRSDAPGYLQAEITTTAVRDAFARRGADAVFPLDADEFLRIPSRDALERALAALPPGHHARIDWPTYVPPLVDDPGDIVALLRSSRRMPPRNDIPANVSRKVALTHHFADDPAATITMGNHDVILGRNQITSPRMPHVELPADMVEVCHVPVRGARQYVVKLAVKRLARVAAGRDYAEGTNVRIAFDVLLKGMMLTPDQVLATQLNLAERDVKRVARIVASPPLADDRFIADIALRYTPAVAYDPLPIVLAAVERLAMRVAAGRPGTQARPPG